MAPPRAAAGASGGGRDPWDLRRFAKTLLAFNPPPEPIATPLRWLVGAESTPVAGAVGATVLEVEPDGALKGPPLVALDDVVMGGVSESRFEVKAGAAEGGAGAAGLFTGSVSESNSGGFASVRTPNFEPAADWSRATGLGMRLKGDGQRYKAILRTEAGWDTVCWCYSFDTVEGEWQDVRVPFSAMFPVFRAKRTGGANLRPADLKHVYSLQIMLSKFEYDGELNPTFRAGDFELPIQSIATYD